MSEHSVYNILSELNNLYLINAILDFQTLKVLTIFHFKLQQQMHIQGVSENIDLGRGLGDFCRICILWHLV